MTSIFLTATATALCLILALTTAAVITTTEEPMTTSEPVKSPDISPEEEAQHIVLDATEAMLPDANMVQKVMREVEMIRSQNPNVAKTVNTGRKEMGKLEVENFKPEMLERIEKDGKFGPVTVSNPNGIMAFMTFTKPYNPDLLSKELKRMGIPAQPIWLRGPDYGHIAYDLKRGQYTFREGLENCKPHCVDNHFWIYSLDKNNTSVLEGEYATDIPEVRYAS